MDPDSTIPLSSMLLTAAEAEPSHPNPLLSILLLAFLIFVNAFFASAEIAVVSLNDNRLKKSAEEGNKKARIIQKLVSVPTVFLATIQIGITLSGFLASAFAADTFAEMLAHSLQSSHVSYDTVKNIAIVVITVLLSFVTLVFGELVPKRLAMKNPEKVSYFCAPVLWVIYFIFRPFVWLLTVSSNLVLRIFKADGADTEAGVTEEEILQMVEDGNESGLIEESQKEMITNIFELDDRTADKIMTHRTDLVAVSENADVAEIIEVAMEHGFSRIPVYRGDIDSIVGILYVKDLLQLVGQDELPGSISEFIREPAFVPETKELRELFKEFTEKHLSLAVVVDEYGGTSGIVTMEDILESIVGSIQDEYDKEEADVEKTGDNRYSIDASTDLDEVERLLRIEFEEQDDYDTLGGLMVGMLGRIPARGEHPKIRMCGYEFTVSEVSSRRIESVDAVKLPESETETLPDGE